MFRFAISSACLAALVACTSAGWADDTPAPHARVSFDAGGTMVKGAQEADWSHAVVNSLILPGDTLWVDQGGTSEIEFARGNFLRLADGSKVDVTAISDAVNVRGWTGSFYVQRQNGSGGTFVFETPSCHIDIARDSAIRIDIVGEGATTVTARWGNATVSTDQGDPTAVHNGERVWVDPGMLASNAVQFDRNVEDSFDAWNRERSEYLAKGSQARPKSVPITDTTIGASDLDNYGEWVTVDDRTQWHPTAVVDYVPYRYGSWSYVPTYGEVWVDNYPFSYITSHYGRWNYTKSYGWCWGYDPVWSPAWCATVRYGDYCVWSPIGWDYRPCSVFDSAYFSVGGLGFSLYASSYAPFGYVNYGPYYIHGLHPNVLDYFHHYNGRDIYPWNIYGGGFQHPPIPFGNDFQWRDNFPHRPLRGLSVLGATGALVADRVRALEANFGRDQFTRVARTGDRGIRTGDNNIAKVAQVRDVHVNQQAPSYTRATRENPENAAAAREARANARSLRNQNQTVANVAPTSGAKAAGRGARGTAESLSPDSRGNTRAVTGQPRSGADTAAGVSRDGRGVRGSTLDSAGRPRTEPARGEATPGRAARSAAPERTASARAAQPARSEARIASGLPQRTPIRGADGLPIFRDDNGRGRTDGLERTTRNGNASRASRSPVDAARTAAADRGTMRGASQSPASIQRTPVPATRPGLQTSGARSLSESSPARRAERSAASTRTFADSSTLPSRTQRGIDRQQQTRIEEEPSRSRLAPGALSDNTSVNIPRHNQNIDVPSRTFREESTSRQGVRQERGLPQLVAPQAQERGSFSGRGDRSTFSSPERNIQSAPSVPSQGRSFDGGGRGRGTAVSSGFDRADRSSDNRGRR